MPPKADRAFITHVAIASVAFVVGAGLIAWAIFSARDTDDTLSVTGSAKETVEADSAKWIGTLSRLAYEGGLSSTHAQVSRDGNTVKEFLNANGVVDADVVVSPVFVEPYYEYRSDGSQGPQRYQVRQTITVNSTDPAKIETVAKKVGELLGRGIVLQANAPEYFYKKLPELRIKLLADALKDAKARAESLASATGQSVGSLQAAASGVVQVLAPNSVEIADYGAYDTQSRTKEVMVTVRASFVLR